MARQPAHQTKPNPEKNPRRDPTAAGQRDAAVNRIASHNYFLLEKFEAGVALTGTEVKSVRTGRANLKDSYGLIEDGELWPLNCHIGPYEHGNIFNHAPLRTRKLLMHKEEIRKLIGKTQQMGLTLIPTRMYFKNGRVKVELAGQRQAALGQTRDRAAPNRGPRGKRGCRPGKKEIVRNPVRRLVREKSERHGHPRAARLPSLTVRSALLSPTQLESLFQAAQLA